MRDRSVPDNGDVVVRQEVHQGKTVYVLGRATGPGQYFLRTQAAAFTHAVMFATREGIQAWTASGNADFGLLPLAVRHTAAQPMPNVATQPVES